MSFQLSFESVSIINSRIHKARLKDHSGGALSLLLDGAPLQYVKIVSPLFEYPFELPSGNKSVLRLANYTWLSTNVSQCPLSKARSPSCHHFFDDIAGLR